MHRYALARHAQAVIIGLRRVPKKIQTWARLRMRNCRAAAAAVLRRRAPYVAFTRDAREID
ncbi:hypothetical protein C6P97_08125 [Burkholderia multivorans]|uniref:Uncharacterized protein n=1 Tax=Burkholderia multivorans TaxID=87883 RepID=A0AB37ASJ4_9BURK|nr:hypothetical protein C6P99_16280 [Burkholderia multivorans]PRE51809.1 hypothetical protein C6P97_08125 [Burkholderia multivorans]